MVELTAKQVQALKITHDALVRIRRLAREPVCPKTMAAIHDLADALHNVPDIVTRRPENQNLAGLFDEELDRDLATAAGIYKREGFPPFAFPEEVHPIDDEVSAYERSGARFHVRQESGQSPRIGALSVPRPGERKGSALLIFFKRVFR